MSAYTTTTGTAVRISPLDRMSNSTVVTSFSNPDYGSLRYNADGSFTYEPRLGFIGADGFRYTTRDKIGTPATHEVTINVCDAARTPTDAEIEAMAEKLWDVWRVDHKAARYGIFPMTWAELLTDASSVAGEMVKRFRAMARVALEGRG